MLGWLGGRGISRHVGDRRALTPPRGRRGGSQGRRLWFGGQLGHQGSPIRGPSGGSTERGHLRLVVGRVGTFGGHVGPLGSHCRSCSRS